MTRRVEVAADRRLGHVLVGLRERVDDPQNVALCTEGLLHGRHRVEADLLPGAASAEPVVQHDVVVEAGQVRQVAVP